MSDEGLLEIHIHGDVPIQRKVKRAALEAALAPLWAHTEASAFDEACTSLYDNEPGIQFDRDQHVLHLCWTVRGSEDFRQQLDEACMALNELCGAGAALEVTFFDPDFDPDEMGGDRGSRDDMLLLFVGPTPQAIMQVQRDLLVQDVVSVMERHFDAAELSGVVAEVDRLFADRLSDLINSLKIGRPPRRPAPDGHFHEDGPGRPRYLH